MMLEIIDVIAKEKTYVGGQSTNGAKGEKGKCGESVETHDECQLSVMMQQ